jgi:lipid A 3-O-deacylase
MITRRFIAVALLTAAPLGAAFSQAPNTLTVRVDNDAFDFWMQPFNRPDEEYTSGVRVSWDGGKSPWWSRALFRNGGDCIDHATSCRTARLEIGQDIYTPSTSLADPKAAASARPNAGWLYVDQTARQLADNRSDQLTVTLGVTGPPALGQQAQSFFHSLAPEFNRPTDWSRQIAFEPGAIVRYEQFHRIGAAQLGPVGMDLIPTVGASVGNIADAVDAGFQARVGWHLPHPWLPSSEPFSFTLLAGATGRAVARDLFLDGNTFASSPRVGHTPFVGSGEWGATLSVGRLALTYRAQTDTRAYAGAPRWHPWSSLVGSFTFSR